MMERKNPSSLLPFAIPDLDSYGKHCRPGFGSALINYFIKVRTNKYLNMKRKNLLIILILLLFTGTSNLAQYPIPAVQLR